jgi:hypothetical protein
MGDFLAIDPQPEVAGAEVRHSVALPIGDHHLDVDHPHLQHLAEGVHRLLLPAGRTGEEKGGGGNQDACPPSLQFALMRDTSRILWGIIVVCSVPIHAHSSKRGATPQRESTPFALA